MINYTIGFVIMGLCILVAYLYTPKSKNSK